MNSAVSKPRGHAARAALARARPLVLLSLAGALGTATPALAAEPEHKPGRKTERKAEKPAAAPAKRARPPVADPASAKALRAFIEGTEFARLARWSRALKAFERAAKLKPHAVTTYNIAACERAMGRYARARQIFSQALSQHAAALGGELPDSLVAQTKLFVRELDGLLATIRLTVLPSQVTVAVDGRPLEASKRRGGPTATPLFLAGTLPPGAGRRVLSPTFDIVLDPGVHVITLTRPGFAPVLINRTLAPGARTSARLELDRLPATLRITAAQQGAIVFLDGKDLGPPPVELLRPAGRYQVAVRKDGFEAYETRVVVRAGEQANMHARLRPASADLLQSWWFWTGAAAVVAGGVTATYFLTRPDPEPPPYDGGSSHWIVSPQIAF